MHTISLRRPLVCLATLALWLTIHAAAAAQHDATAGKETTAGRATPESFNRYLATGEFSLARAAADRLEAGPAQDGALASIAARQQAAGAKQAAIDTLADIADDTIRGQLIGGGGGGRGGFGGGGGGVGGQGGGGNFGIGGGGGAQQSQADFDTLIDLITTTVEPDTWEEVGGQGTIAGFPGGVYVDGRGILRQTKSAAQRLEPQNSPIAEGQRVTISLPRLEKALQLRRAAGLPPTPQMQTLGGLQRIESIHVYPETGDLVIAGPQAHDPESSLRLDDLVVVATAIARGDGRFGCSINPRQQHLKRTQDFLKQTSQRALRPGERPQWLQQLAQLLGRQDIEVFGLPAATGTAQTLVYADYHMKLIGMGIEPGPTGLQSYLDRLKDYPGQLPPLDVLRWWFTANYDSVAINEDQTVFQLVGDAVRVLSENEMLNALGQRVTTSQSHPVNSEFASDFTEHFDQLAASYPFYARLRGIFDLAVAAAILFEEDLPARVGWQPTMLTADDGYLVPSVTPATEVDSVIGHRVTGGTHIVAGVSGGVSFDAKRVLASKRVTSNDYSLTERQRRAMPHDDRGRDEEWSW